MFATLFGLATSLGIGAEQANAGLELLFGLSETDTSKVLLIIGITAIALISVVAGLEAGVKRLSEINMVLAILLLLFVVVAGPTLAIVTGFFRNLVAYAEYLPALSNPFGREDDNFRQGWTAFYWAWWISWSPFVGMFIARVSPGAHGARVHHLRLDHPVDRLRALDDRVRRHRRSRRSSSGSRRSPTLRWS